MILSVLFNICIFQQKDQVDIAEIIKDHTTAEEKINAYHLDKSAVSIVIKDQLNETK